MGYHNWSKFIVYTITVLFSFMYIAVCHLNSHRLIKAYVKLFPSERDLDVTVNFYKFVKKEENVIFPKKDENITFPKKDGNDTKYILLWTSAQCVPFNYLGKGQETFIKESCRYINCYVTDNENYLGDITKFDVVAFNGPQLIQMTNNELPQKRSPHQKYVFASIESSHYYPVIDNIFDEYFNWTWTYKLDSDTRWGYFTVRNTDGNVIGPNKVMHWMKTEDMEPVSNDLMAILKGKSKVVAWFASNCNTESHRESFVADLQNKLKIYGLNIDIYGACGSFYCGQNGDEVCNELIEKNYFFYLALENAFSEDYVTEKILQALQNSAIPIVYGSANYTRFLPDGSYLNARKLGTIKLAATMYYLVHNIEEYSKYFKWRNHYYYHSKGATEETNDYCGICALLNDKRKMEQKSVYRNFRQWWNRPEDQMKLRTNHQYINKS